jgi:hypothetical protein
MPVEQTKHIRFVIITIAVERESTTVLALRVAEPMHHAGPARETVLARDHELCIREADVLSVGDAGGGMPRTSARDRVRVASAQAAA